MGEGGDSHARELDQTPTWAVASVVAVIILISIILEKVIHTVGKYFTKRNNKALFEALEKVKGELMVLGFISLLLTIGQNYISRICVPMRIADSMLPCPYRGPHETDTTTIQPEHTPQEEHHLTPDEDHHRRRLLWNDHRLLSDEGGAEVRCQAGYVPLISLHGLHQLHIFIFFLAVFHVVYSAITMMLGRLKIRGWKEWERETSSHNYEASNDPSRFRLTHETSFVKSHSSFWTKVPFFFYIGCFFRQFFRSVRRSDYLTMRNGFVTVHLAPGSQFNFQKYIKRSLEDDFKVVVGISPLLWASVVLFLLINVDGWEALFWISIIPLIVILSVGTKLQAIIAQMALEIQEKHAVVQGIPLVQVTDKHFWFGWPELVLYLIHFTLFQNAFQITYFLWIWNAFQITYFLWIWYEFGLNSCFHESFNLIIMKVILGVVVQFMCSYITLPLYALVTQMGSTMKKSIFDEQTSKALRKWHMKAVNKKNEGPSIQVLEGNPSASSSMQIQSQNNRELSDLESSASTATLTPTIETTTRQQQHTSTNDHQIESEGFTEVDLLTGP